MSLAAAGWQKAEQAGSGCTSVQRGCIIYLYYLSFQKELPHLAVNLSFAQVSSSKMELVLQYLSARAFTMAHRMHKDTCCSKDAAFGEATTEKA